MMKKCNGCGAILQKEHPELEGFIRETNFDKSDICERCFRIKNYGDYKQVEKSNINFIPILKKINDTNDLVVLVIDIFGINKDMKEITKYLSNDILLVFTKRDVLPLSVSDEKLLNYADQLDIPYMDKIIVSSNKNYEFDQLIEKIKAYQKSKNVYIVGYTNAGKSTMINKLIYNYSDLKSDVTTSILPSTTLDTIEIQLDETLTLIDTPGILEEESMIHFVDAKTMKKMLPMKEIKPITYQVKGKQYIYIDSLVEIEVEDNNLTFFFSNQLKIDRFYKKKKHFNLKENMIRVKENEDVVIAGLGFIKVTKNGILKVYTIDGVDVYTRESLI